MRKTSLLLILALALTSLALVPTDPSPAKTPSTITQGTTDYPWLMFHNNPLRTGSSPTTAPGTPTLMWTKVTGAPVYASPAVSDGIVFIPSWDGNLYALDEYSGQLKWSFSTSGSIYASPAVSNGIVYVASRDGQVYAINELTGTQIWRTNNIFNTPGNPITSSPLVANGKVFFGTWCLGGLCNPAGHFEALDAATGNVLWINSTTAAVVSSPAIDNGIVFFGEDDGSVLAVNGTNGHGVWATTVSGGALVRSAPAIGYGRVYLGTARGFVALNELTGTTSWTFNTNNANATSAAIGQGAVYFGTGRGNVYAVNATTGAQIWGPTVSSGAVTSSPALAMGSKTLLVGSNDHYLYALDMTNGARLWRYATGGVVSSSPALADGRVFFGSQDSVVYALGAKIPQLHVTVSPDKTSLLPGELSNLTITVTDGTNPVLANLTITSSAGGGVSSPAELSPGLYASNYTAPLVTSPSSATIQVIATAAGFLDGTSQTSIILNPYPALTVVLSAEPTSVSPGGSLVLTILVQNGTIPIAGATISLSSSQGGSFSDLRDVGDGSYRASYTPELQNTNPTLTVQASKAAFSPGQAQITVAVNGIPDLTKAKAFGIPVVLIAAGVLLLLLISLMALVASKRKDAIRPNSYGPSYALNDGPLSPGSLI